MNLEEYSLLISVVSAFIALASLIIIFLIQLWNVRLRGIEYQIERNTKLLEQCFGPLSNYFNQTIVIKELFTDISIEGMTGSTNIFRFRAGLLEKMERIWDQYNFEIKRLNSKLGNEIQFIITNALGKRSRGDKLEIYYIKTPPSKYLPTEFNDDELDIKESEKFIKNALEKWRKEIINQVQQTTNSIAKKLNKDISLREDRKKLLRHLFMPYS